MNGPGRAERPISGPQRLQQMHFSFAVERTLTVSLQFDLYSHIAAGKKSAAEIAKAAGTSERGMRMLLDALAGLELLEKRDGVYELTADAARYLVRGSPEYLGFLLSSDNLWTAWTHLADAVRDGAPKLSASRQEVAEEFFPPLVRTLHITNAEPARHLAAHLVPAGSKGGLRVLDIGCGSGVWSIAIAKADPSARVTALDFPKVLEVTREYVVAADLGGRYEYAPGDFHAVALPDRQFDLAILGNIVHGEGEEMARRLFTRIHRALDAGGRLAIIDMIPNDERTGPSFPLLFALNMLVATDHGNTYTLAEYRAWLSAAGFAAVETVDIASHSPAVVATKA